MLELKDISLEVGRDSADQILLAEITATIPRGHFMAVIGPSGCGKSTLLKVIAGIKEHTGGGIHWKGNELSAENDLSPHEIGYVPQFSIAHELLTVEECVEGALKLRVAGLESDEFYDRAEATLKSTGLDDIATRRVALLSGGQKRRLAMAMEMVSSPSLLLCDEVTSGLDPKSEDEIVRLMRELSRRDERIVVNVTHSLRHLLLFDSVVVLYQGHLAFHGAPTLLRHYFGINTPEDLYPRLAERRAHEWKRSWGKYRDLYYEQSKLPAIGSQAAKPESKESDPVDSEESAVIDPQEIEKLCQLAGSVITPAPTEPSTTTENKEPAPPTEASPPSSEPRSVETPSAFSQFFVLLARRWKLLFRDRGQCLLQLALLLGFPCLVVIFALDGLPAIKNLSTPQVGSMVEKVTAELTITQDISCAGSIVSGLVMFQVILLALMGCNNSAREIASERHLLEKEKFAGLSPLAYVLSKVAFLGVLVLAQSLWMAAFVNQVIGFPGSFFEQALQLVLVNGALTSVCLGISAWMKTAEQASLLSIYLVGFQLPLSGSVLALPKAISGFTQIFIASYWGWSGFIKAMKDTPYYGAAAAVTQTPLQESALCLWVLLAHIILGIFFTYTGVKNSRWE